MPAIKEIKARCIALYYKDVYGASAEIPGHVLWPIPHVQVRPRDGAFATLVYVHDDAGHVGIGEALTMWAPQVSAEIVERVLAPVLIGWDPLDLEVLWQRMYQVDRPNGQNRGYNMEAISAIDIALWDLAGQILNQPVYRLLGGAFRKQIRTYASPVPIMDDDEVALALARRFVDDGFSGIKIKVGRRELARDANLVHAIRNRVGGEIELMLDANGAYDMYTALSFVRLLRGANVAWFEEPFPPEDADAYLALKRNVDVPLAAGEAESTSYNFRRLIASRAVDVIQPNVARVGGFTAARRLAAMADAHHLPIAPHGVGGAVFLAATLHWAASLVNFLSVEYNRRPNALRDQLLVEPLAYANGHLHVPEGPGLGIRLDEDFLEKITV